MTTGQITPDLDAILRLTLRGTNGIDANLEFALDTGFSGEMALPRTWITALALTYDRPSVMTLADGTTIVVDVYRGTVVWDGHERAVLIDCVEGYPLVGTRLLLDHLVTLPVVIGRSFTIDAIP